MPSSPHGKNLRFGRVSQPDAIYVITTVTLRREKFFADFSAARRLIQVLREHDQRGLAKTLCFVVMPDHLHWMMQLGAARDLGEIVRSVKSLTSRRLGRPCFQKGFYDHALRRVDDARRLARYIVNNPLRAGLAQRQNDYPHWDAIWLE